MIGILFTLSFFLFPGLLLLAIRHPTFFPKLTLIEKLPISIASSLAYWMISFWFLQYIPIPLHIHIYTTIGISAAAFILFFIKGKISVSGGRQNIVVGLFFLLLMAPAFFVALREVAPSGADMSMQAYIAKKIFLTNGFPKTLEPIVPVSQFGTYPVGFPILIASLMKTNALPVYTNALWLSVFAYWFFTVSVFVLLRSVFPVFVSIVVAVIISWVSNSPYNFVFWGANPTILSFVFLVFGFAAFLHCKNNVAAGFGLLFLYASWLTHYMLPTAIGYLSILFIPFFWSLITRLASSLKQFRWPSLIAFTCVLPWIVHTLQNMKKVTPATLSFVANLQRDEVIKLSGEMTASISPLTTLYDFYTYAFGTPVILLYLLSLGILLFHRPKIVLLHGVAIIGVSILVMNALYWWLPFSYLLYPQRVALMLLIPVALAAASALEYCIHTVYRHFIIHNTRNRLLLNGIAVLLLWFVYAPHIQATIRGYTKQNALYVVTPSDIAAMRWLTENTTPTDVIQNNYSDAGLWIPAIADRKITHYHTNPFDMDVFKKEERATYAYIGKKTLTNPPGADPVNREALSGDPEHFILVYDHDGVAIYKINRTE